MPVPAGGRDTTRAQLHHQNKCRRHVRHHKELMIFDVRKKHSEVVRLYDGSERAKNNLLFFSWTPWHKMQRLEFIRKNNIKFEEVKRGNDVFFSFQIGYFLEKFKVD